jgi:hypothetical protein
MDDGTALLLLGTFILVAFVAVWYVSRMETRCWQLEIRCQALQAEAEEAARLRVQVIDLEQRNARLQVAILPRPRGATGPQTPLPALHRWSISDLGTSLVPICSPPEAVN